MTDRIAVEVDCPVCRDRHTLGIPAGHTGPIEAWCVRSARRYIIDPTTLQTRR